MGTRGAFGFRRRGKTYMIYNHFDSYPSGLGCWFVSDIQEILKTMTLEDLGKIIDAFIVYDEHTSTCSILGTGMNIPVDTSKSYDDGYNGLQEIIKNGYIRVMAGDDIASGQYDIEYYYILDFDNELFEACDLCGIHGKYSLSEILRKNPF